MTRTPSVWEGDMNAAARLLVAIAGPERVHIEMSARGPKKYYDVHRPFAERDGRLHLQGWKTKGATLRYPDGMTRALCYDADTPTDWQRLQEAARALAACGYAPLLEASPVGRGGHLWIIYSGLVEASWAQHHAVARAPGLQEIGEYWPGAGHKVRLPGGKYMQPGFAAWCTLADAAGTVLATDGASAARALLDFQTPAATVVPASPPEMSRALHGSRLVAMPNRQEQEAARHKRSFGQVDSRWYEKYGRSLWFQFTPGQLAALYNERHPLSELLPLEHNGMAFSPAVEERTPSTAITKDGRAWIDFSARNRHPDGKHDGGDALELVARRNGETKTNKRGTMQEAARAMVREAKAALEEAAREGIPPPPWVASIMTRAGWQHYRWLREEGQREAQATAARGVTGFQAMITGHGGQESRSSGAAQPTDSAQAVLREEGRGQDVPEALAAEIGAAIGEPCGRCGCTLSYHLAPYQMCYRCYPRHLTDAQWRRLRALFPRRPTPLVSGAG